MTLGDRTYICFNGVRMKLRFEPVRRMSAAAVEEQTVPGLVLLAAAAGQVAFGEAFGARQLEPRHLPAFRDTLYDVASLTKAVATSVLAMREVGAGRLSLDRPVVELLPEFAGAPAVLAGRGPRPFGTLGAVTDGGP